jgi:hypothetical protein
MRDALACILRTLALFAPTVVAVMFIVATSSLPFTA